jgi:hypothetical protein
VPVRHREEREFDDHRRGPFRTAVEPNDRLTIEPSFQMQSVRSHDLTGMSSPSDPSQHLELDHSTDERPTIPSPPRA